MSDQNACVVTVYALDNTPVLGSASRRAFPFRASSSAKVPVFATISARKNLRYSDLTYVTCKPIFELFAIFTYSDLFIAV